MLTIKCLSQLLHVSQSTIKRMVKDGSLPKPTKAKQRQNVWNIEALSKHSSVLAEITSHLSNDKTAQRKVAKPKPSQTIQTTFKSPVSGKYLPILTSGLDGSPRACFTSELKRLSNTFEPLLESFRLPVGIMLTISSKTVKEHRLKTMSEVIKPINHQLQSIKITPCIWRGCEEVTANGKHYHITIMFDASSWAHKEIGSIKRKIRNALKRLPFKAWFGENDIERLERIRLVKCWGDYCDFFEHTSYQAKVATKPKRDKQSLLSKRKIAFSGSRLNKSAPENR
ncbi:helix-turn-helix transcriptional regulator [Vibrio splendidus]